MPYNEEVESRIMRAISGWKNTDRKNMFGGVCHLLKGNMFCGVYKDFLILRLGEERANEALALPCSKPFDITGRAMKGWIMVDEDGFRTDEELKSWLKQAREFADTLAPKLAGDKERHYMNRRRERDGR